MAFLHSPLKILHVDDDHPLRLMTRTALNRSGKDFLVESCASAHDALSKIENFQPHLLLVDFMMPIMDGPSFVAKVHSLGDAFRLIPVVFITGKDDIAFENRAALEPIIGIIRKPFSPVTLGDDLEQLWMSYEKRSSAEPEL